VFRRGINLRSSRARPNRVSSAYFHGSLTAKFQFCHRWSRYPGQISPYDDFLHRRATTRHRGYRTRCSSPFSAASSVSLTPSSLLWQCSSANRNPAGTARELWTSPRLCSSPSHGGRGERDVAAPEVYRRRRRVAIDADPRSISKTPARSARGGSNLHSHAPVEYTIALMWNREIDKYGLCQNCY